MLAFLLLAILTSDPADFVRALYANAGAAAPDPVFGVTSRKALLETFEGPIVDLLWRDLVDAQGEVGRMDAHYLFDAQDDEISNLQVKTVENANGRARVRATFEFPSEKKSIEFLLRKTKDGWRISDIAYGGGRTYRKILEADFPVPKIEDERSADALCHMYSDYAVKVQDEDVRELAETLANEKHDFGAAIHVLCTDDDNMADAEVWGMLDHVLKMERGITDEPLDFCDHATSTYGGMICAGRRDDEERPLLRTRYDAVRKKSGKALDPLRAAADAFIEADAHWENETMRGGTIYSYVGTLTELDRETKFIDLLEKYSGRRAPAASEEGFRRVDAELNAAYRARQTDIEDEERSNLRAAQRAWIAYRDAWIGYYRDRWRVAASPEALGREIAVALMKERIAELKN